LLVGFDTRGGVSAVAYTFEVIDFGSWLIDDAQTFFANTKCQICIFVVSGCVMGVKTTHVDKEFTPHCQYRAGAIINIAHIIKARIFTLLVTPPVPATGVAPDNAASLLHAAIATQ